MIVKQCDRCQKIYRGTSIRVNIVRVTNFLSGQIEDIADLCPDCEAEFNEFLNIKEGAETHVNYNH